jgi:hypothetical protein
MALLLRKGGVYFKDLFDLGDQLVYILVEHLILDQVDYPIHLFVGEVNPFL